MKYGKEIFRQTIEYAGEAASPVNTDEAGTCSKALTESGALDPTTECEIFYDLHADGFKASHLLVHRRSYEVECADSYSVSECFGVRDSPCSYSPEAHNLKVGEEHAFACRLDEGGG